MRISQAYPSRYVRAADIPDGQRVLVTIESIDIEDVGGDKDPEDQKPVLYFAGKHKGMVLNKTNAQIITAVHGDDTDNWIGQQIFLTATETQFKGDIVPCLRVAMPKQTNGGAVAQPRKPLQQQVAERPAPTNPVSEEPQFAPDDVPF